MIAAGGEQLLQLEFFFNEVWDLAKSDLSNNVLHDNPYYSEIKKSALILNQINRRILRIQERLELDFRTNVDQAYIHDLNLLERKLQIDQVFLKRDLEQFEEITILLKKAVDFSYKNYAKHRSQ